MSGEVRQNTSVATGVIATAPTATESASDPAYNTNPESVGAEWHNTTSGQIFICTDNTASANFWIGQRGKNIVGSRCLFAGGQQRQEERKRLVDVHTRAMLTRFQSLSIWYRKVSTSARNLAKTAS